MNVVKTGNCKLILEQTAIPVVYSVVGQVIHGVLKAHVMIIGNRKDNWTCFNKRLHWTVTYYLTTSFTLVIWK